MQRAAKERQRAFLEHKEYRLQQLRFGDRDYAAKLPINYFRKTWRRGGCMKSRCYLCHSEKLFGWPTLFELRAADAQRDGEEECYEPGQGHQARQGEA